MLNIKTNDGHIEIEMEGYPINIITEMFSAMRAFTRYLAHEDEEMAKLWLKELEIRGVDVCRKSDSELKEDIERAIEERENNNFIYPEHIRHRRH